MKFKVKAGVNPNLVVWDKDNNRILCKFKNGEFSTDDGRTMRILEERGFENDGVIEVPFVEVVEETHDEDDKKSDDVKYEDMPYADYFKIAVEKGYDVTVDGKKKEPVLKFLNGLEG
jgi:hypothetical protein